MHPDDSESSDAEKKSISGEQADSEATEKPEAPDDGNGQAPWMDGSIRCCRSDGGILTRWPSEGET